MPPRFVRACTNFGETDFRWDLDKNERNLAKHGMDFAFARTIFRSSIMRRRDTRKKVEVVFQAIGDAGGVTLYVVYTVRDRLCRIISARLADAEEARVYHEQ